MEESAVFLDEAPNLPYTVPAPIKGRRERYADAD